MSAAEQAAAVPAAKAAGGAKGKGKGKGKGGKPAKAGAGGGGKSTAKRDYLQGIADTVQAQWAEMRLYEEDAPQEGETPQPKYFTTFPYPYMNGSLHLGHAFSVTKAEFATRYQRLKGRRALFPFAFHCTGMPIQAAANKLRRQIEDEAAVAAGEAPAAAAAAAAGAGAEEVEDATPAVGTFKSKKTKTAAKTGGLTQREILVQSGVPAEEVEAFADPKHWLDYFPPRGRQSLQNFGVAVDWRRSFITTDANPYYDSFIQWQFRLLKKLDKIGFGTRPTVYSPRDGQACADHDRSEGEGVGPQEYTLIKMEVQRDAAGALPAALAGLDTAVAQPLVEEHVTADEKATRTAADAYKALFGEEAPANVEAALAPGARARKVFLVAATLRPETMYGQTNCFVHPDHEYGAYAINHLGDIFICSHMSARLMAYQGLSPVYGTPYKLADVSGMDMMGLALAAPNAAYDTVYCLPLLTIKQTKGTGVVTSVPSDAPDDWAALRDLQRKPEFRAKYNITAEMVEPFEVVEIIDIPGYGRRAGVTACDKFGVQSQNDREKLALAKDEVYTKGFYTGELVVGPWAGKKVNEAKDEVRQSMVAAGQALPYWQPEKKVVSRTGDECVVVHLDQWFLRYGDDEAWRQQLDDHIHSDRFTAFSSQAMDKFEFTLGWLGPWACSRNFGLGTLVPFDKQYVIESLSDSTIYMAYYTVAHLLQGNGNRAEDEGNGVYDGRDGGPLGITAEQMTDASWEYVMRRGDYDEEACGGIPEEKLATLRREFEYWYPMDLRTSGKDLIQNHLTFCLYNHAAIWGADPERMPQGFFTNGHVKVDDDKMSKSKGNFITLDQGIRDYSPDGTRFALAQAGDGLEDANFSTIIASEAVVRIVAEDEWMKEVLAADAEGQLRAADSELSFFDKVLDGRVSQCIAEADTAYAGMRFRDAQKWSWHMLLKARDAYRDVLQRLDRPMHAGVLRRLMEALVVMNAPIIPHWSEHAWCNLLKQDGSVTRAAWPQTAEVDSAALDAGDFVIGYAKRLRAGISDEQRRHKREKLPAPTGYILYCATEYAPYQSIAIQRLRAAFEAGGLAAIRDKAFMKTARAGVDKADMKVYMAFLGKLRTEIDEDNAEALLSETPVINDLEVLSANSELLRDMVEVAELRVLPKEEAEAAGHGKRAARAIPGTPVVQGFEA